MKNLLILLTNSRVNEKIRCIVPELSKYYNIDLYLIGEMSINTEWYGDIDERKLFLDSIKDYVKNIIVGEGFKYHGDSIKSSHFKYINNLRKYDGILYDDNRDLNVTKINELYNEARKIDIPVIGNSHGNQEFKKENLKGFNKVFDFVFILGEKEKLIYNQIYDDSKLLKSGIPANDKLKNYKKNNKHILIITNFLETHYAKNLFPIIFNKQFIEDSGLYKLQKKYNKKIIIKQKTRLDQPDYIKNINHINSIMSKNIDYEIVTNCDDHFKLVADSFCTITYPSTMAFKPIQLGIPTVIIKNSGYVGNFYDFKGLINIDKNLIENEIDRQVNNIKEQQFIKTTLEGGIDFTSSNIYINKIREVI